MNVSFNVGDDRDNVRRNRKIIAQCLKAEELVFIDQVHGDRVLVLAEKNEPAVAEAADGLSGNALAGIGDGPAGGVEAESGRPLIGDAVVTNIPQKNLVIQVADCQAVFLYEPVQQIVANIHAGWRGSVTNIIGRTIKVIEEDFGGYSQNIVAGISPSLGPCCAEFINYRHEIPVKYWQYKDDRDHFDFWSISRSQLCNAGVKDENIDVGQVCTKCDSGNFFSYRGEGTTGRFATVIGLK